MYTPLSIFLTTIPNSVVGQRTPGGRPKDLKKLVQFPSTPHFARLSPLSCGSMTARTATFPANCFSAQYRGQDRPTEISIYPP